MILLISMIYNSVAVAQTITFYLERKYILLSFATLKLSLSINSEAVLKHSQLNNDKHVINQLL